MVTAGYTMVVQPWCYVLVLVEEFANHVSPIVGFFFFFLTRECLVIKVQFELEKYTQVQSIHQVYSEMKCTIYSAKFLINLIFSELRNLHLLVAM